MRHRGLAKPWQKNVALITPGRNKMARRIYEVGGLQSSRKALHTSICSWGRAFLASDFMPSSHPDIPLVSRCREVDV